MSYNAFTMLARAASTLLLAASLLACGSEPVGTVSADATELALPAEGSCEAEGMLAVANELDFEALDVDVALDRRAAENIVAQRPFASLAALDEVSWVGPAALGAILRYAEAEGYLATCAAGGVEIGIVSDLDKTVIPHAEPDLSEAPYPGVTRLYQILEGVDLGDMHYVTARSPDRVTEIPAYLEAHDVPAGPIETGISGLPWVAQPEKVKDISGVLDATGGQAFLLFGDSSHRDPEAYQEIQGLYPERIVAGFIHKVNATVSEHRVEGLYLHESYCEVAAILYGLDVLSRAQALEVMRSAQAEGEAIDDDAIEALLAAQE